ncbi:uncharacterized protein LOC105196826 [Solenopsis invicta]|uniref:uncharacterized protein LOC105196826 n=1 Tax=Solenopsis invicta TaxID=13686 RepID=UPI000E33DD2C|nr:uncharacterized protein LOC105196826 [Solenopsis invicta]
MKLRKLLVVTWCSIIMARSEPTESDQDTLLRKAAEQLERLAPYRRIAEDSEESNLSSFLEEWKSSIGQNELDTTKSGSDQNVSWEIPEISPEQTESDTNKRIDDQKMIAISVITDPRYAALMRERIKRGFDYGSASLLTSIAGGVLSGVASASSGSAAKASASSSEAVYKQPAAYGAPTVEHAYPSYEEKPFGPWDFKKAIFSTMFQALKAIGGGVLALKGQLVKGGGYLLAGKGKVVSKAGDVITSFGKQLAASAQAKPYPPEPYYDYPPYPPTQHIGPDPGYPRPPPNSDISEVPGAFSAHEAYGVPSDDNGQGGLLIVTPTKSDLDSNQHTNVVAVQESPDHTKLEESFGGSFKNSANTAIKNILNSVPKGSTGSKDQTVAGQNSLNNNNNNNNVDSYPPAQHPPYGIPDHYPANHNNPAHNYEQNYSAVQDDIYKQPELLKITSQQNYPAAQNSAYQQPELQTLDHFPNFELDPNLSDQLSLGYPPLQYPNPHNSLLNSPKLPHNDDDTSVYASISVDTEPQIAPLKVSLLNSHQDVLDLPKLQPHADFHGQPQFANYLHGSLGGPLRVPLLSPMPSAYYWQSQGSLVPASALDTLNHFRKRNILQRRAFAKRLARYASLQKMRLHRL